MEFLNAYAWCLVELFYLNNKSINQGIDCSDPRVHGKALTANLKGMWRYRIGDYRMLCLIEDEKLIITSLNIGHRREIYK